MRSPALFTVLLVALAAPVPAADTAFTVGPFERIYDPGVGETGPWYINDHCFIRHPSGQWHLYGITHAEPAAPLDEDHLAHATAAQLTQQPWDKLPFALDVDPGQGETHLWAPHIIRHRRQYYMFYCAGGPDHARYRIHLATSPDLQQWTRYPDNPVLIDGYDARDPFVMRLGDQWVMYYTATSAPTGGNYIVAAAVSTNLTHWAARHTVFTDPARGAVGGPTESPTVIRRGPYYYLFIGPRGGYVGTDIFRSTDPLHWELADLVGHIEAHAAEVVRDVDGKWYVSRCGWGQGGVELAPLTWHDGVDDNDTSMPTPATAPTTTAQP